MYIFIETAHDNMPARKPNVRDIKGYYRIAHQDYHISPSMYVTLQNMYTSNANTMHDCL